MLPSQRAVTTDRQALWENAQVPYVLDSSLCESSPKKCVFVTSSVMTYLVTSSVMTYLVAVFRSQCC